MAAGARLPLPDGMFEKATGTRTRRFAHRPAGLAAGRRDGVTGYALDQPARPVVLDTAKSRLQGFTPDRDLGHHLAHLAGQLPGRT